LARLERPLIPHSSESRYADGNVMLCLSSHHPCACIIPWPSEQIASQIAQLLSTPCRRLIYKACGFPYKNNTTTHQRGFHRNERAQNVNQRQSHVTCRLHEPSSLSRDFIVFVRELFIASTDLLPEPIHQLRSFRISILSLAKGNFSRKEGCADAQVIPTTL
jgi:hypothetical protein